MQAAVLRIEQVRPMETVVFHHFKVDIAEQIYCHLASLEQHLELHYASLEALHLVLFS